MKRKCNIIWVLLMIPIVFIAGCNKEDDNSDNNTYTAQMLSDAFIVSNSEKVKGDLPTPTGLAKEWSVLTPEIELIEGSSTPVKFSCTYDSAITALFIKIDGTDSYYKVFYDNNGDYVFGKKEGLLSAMREAGMGVTANDMAPAEFSAPATVTGVFGVTLGATSPLPMTNLDNWLKPIPIRIKVKKDPSNPCAGSTLSATVNINGNQATAIASKGRKPYRYLWSNNSTSERIDNLSNGTYSVTITDANQCKKTAVATIGGGGSNSFTLNGVTYSGTILTCDELVGSSVTSGFRNASGSISCVVYNVPSAGSFPLSSSFTGGDYSVTLTTDGTLWVSESGTVTRSGNSFTFSGVFTEYGGSASYTATGSVSCP
jgi:hypothetical protein